MEYIIKTGKIKWNIARIILLTLCAVIFAFGIFAVTHRSSAIFAMAGSAAVAIVTIFWTRLWALFRKLRSHRAGRIVINAIIACILLAALYTAVLSGLMIGAFMSAPPDNATLIVLGCQVRGEEPSLMLYRRMDAALKFMRDNPEANAILSGGQGPGEWITEAEAMRRYITGGGISERRLFIEDRSTSTYENVMFSKAIIEEHGLSRNIAVATNGFHQYRTQSFAKDAGLTPGAVPARTPVYTLPFYWLREIAAITLQIVFN